MLMSSRADTGCIILGHFVGTIFELQLLPNNGDLREVAAKNESFIYSDISFTYKFKRSCSQ